MALKPDDISVAPIGGSTLVEIVADVTTPLGVYVQLRGADAVNTVSRALVKFGSSSIALTTDHSVNGEVTTSITAANLTTLGASQLDVLTLYWSGTLTDGDDSREWRFKQLLWVGDRLTVFPIDYDRLTTRIGVMSKACALPSGQTNWWPQITIALEDLRDEINSKQDGVKTFLLDTPGELRRLAEAYAISEVLRYMYLQVNGRSDGIAAFIAEWDKAKVDRWTSTMARVKTSGTAWETDASVTRANMQPVRFWGGRGGSGYGGGPL